MKDLLLGVKDGIYGIDLHLHLLSLKNQFKSSEELAALISLSSIQLMEISSDCELDKYEILIDSEFLSFSINKEISAKWKDYLFNKTSKNKADNLKEAFLLYKNIYEETKNYNYLIKALNLVRRAKGIFNTQLEDLYEYSKNEFNFCNSSFQQSQLIREIYSINSEKIIEDFQVLIANKIELKLVQNKYNSARLLIDSLKYIKVIDNNQCKIDRAKSYELEGDYHAKDKEKNTYYPRILDSYTKGLKELKSVDFPQEIKIRLEKKIKNEQLLYSNILKGLGFSNENFGDDIDKYISKNEINNFKKAFSELISFDVISVEDINKNNSERADFSLSVFFQEYNKINSKGAVVGISSQEEFLNYLDRNLFRESTISFINKMKFIMDCDKFIKKDLVMKLLLDCNSRFVPENRLYMFVEGIYAGFCNNYILAAHILIPQIENSFKFVLEQNDKFTTRYAEDKQSDNTLGAFLNSDKGEGMLKDICSQNLFEELSDFLINSKGTNFRNELCHGLMEPFLIEHYGKYLWWLSLKMIIQTDNYFVFPKEE